MNSGIQSIPVLAVKPDGTKLFVAWYDRRNDTNNSLIDMYGCWGVIGVNGEVSLTNEFRISTVSYPPVFAGTRGEAEPIYTQAGYYDPVYPPLGVNLNWWYPEWPDDPPETTDLAYRSHVGEYNGAHADAERVYVTWTDNRLVMPGALAQRSQNDIRLVRIAWP